jgi:hypothetical protein
MKDLGGMKIIVTGGALTADSLCSPSWPARPS